MQTLQKIQQEHNKIIDYLDKIQQFIEGTFEYNEFYNLYKEFLTFLNNHEKNESQFFPMFEEYSKFKEIHIDHKAIKGYNKVIALALETHYEPYIKVTLEIDGKMLIRRLREHIKKEEEFLKKTSESISYPKTL